MPIDRTNWSGEGTFTATCVEVLDTMNAFDLIRVEDAPASRADSGFTFISNEIYLHPRARFRSERVRLAGLPLWTRLVREATVSTDWLRQRLAGQAGIGDADFADGEMLQYLRTERIVPPYQVRGFKLVELVRIYLMPEREQGRGAARPEPKDGPVGG